MKVKDLRASLMSEDDLLEAVLDAARIGGWLVHHCRPARRADGSWSTPLQGSRGLPDLVLVHPAGRTMFRELKSERGVVEHDQRRWLDALAAAGADAGVWRPRDWTSGVIEAELLGHRFPQR